MKTALIVNPSSANGRTGREWNQTASRLSAAGLEYSTLFTKGPGDATILARQALEAGHATVAAVGGDGTLNEVANGFFRGGAVSFPEARLGLIPLGTGGDFRRSLDIPLDLESAARLLVSDRWRSVDVGLVKFVDHRFAPAQRVFLNIADLGIGGEVVETANRSSKALGGRVSFQLASLRTLVRYRNQRMRITADGEALELVAQQAVVANGRYFGGGMMIAPDADPGDGLLELVVVGDMGRVESIRKMGSIYQGRHMSDPKVLHRRVRRIEVECDQRLLLDVDGEQPGMAPATFSLIPGALRLVAP